MPPVPKKKHSHQRTTERRNSKRFVLPLLVKCKSCGKKKLPHIVCPSCGSKE